MVPSDLGAVQSGPVQILVVEDEPLIRFVIAEALRELDAGVVEAATADEAWDYLQSGAPIDLVFTDHRMPGSMSGAELALRVQEEYPGIEIVLTSAHYQSMESSLPVLNKPYNLFNTASDLVRRALQGRQRGNR